MAAWFMGFAANADARNRCAHEQGFSLALQRLIELDNGKRLWNTMRVDMRGQHVVDTCALQRVTKTEIENAHTVSFQSYRVARSLKTLIGAKGRSE